jgi:glycosyltransferase involved in cell wall biosynthesis
LALWARPYAWSYGTVRFADSASIPVSVVVPAFNSEAFIAEALRSIGRQTLQPTEIIVVDDASTDATAKIAAGFGARVIRQPRNAGPSAARNAGVRAASGDWIAFLDADDLWADDKLALQWEAVRHWPDAGFCFTDYDTLQTDAAPVESGMAGSAGYKLARAVERYGPHAYFMADSFVDGLVRSMFVRQSSVMVNRALFLKNGGYDESLRLGEDYDLFLRLIGDAPAVAIESSLVTYRRHAASLTADRITEVASVDTLWEVILGRPERYPERAIHTIRKQRVLTLLAGVRMALRLGRFADAAPFARKALDLQRSPSTLFWALFVRLMSNPGGRFVHHRLRAAWRRRRAESA